MSEPTYQEWCRRYGYDPQSQQAQRDWQESREALAALYTAAGTKREAR